MWEIAKSFSFCYGHRVWSQKLDPELSVNGSCKCRHYHGHEGRVEVGLRGSSLTNGMITDFKNLQWLKEFLDTYLDHKFIVDIHDPLYEMLTREKQFLEDIRRKAIVVPSYDHSNYKGAGLVFEALPSVDAVLELEEYMQEHFASFFLVSFIPTSENLSAWLANLIRHRMPKEVEVSFVDWWETPTSHARFVF